MEASRYQKAIYQFIQSGTGNGFIDGVAGCGKTTTIVIGAGLLPEQKILFLAFNKSIAEELQSRLAGNCEAKTLNSFGNRILAKTGWKKLDASKDSYLLADVMGIKLKEMRTTDKDLRTKYYTLKGPITKLISLYKAFYPEEFDLLTVAEAYDVEIPEYDDFNDIFDAVLQKSIHHKTMIDFNDQIFMPIFFNLPMPKYDLVLVDEAQDLNPVQIELVTRLAKAGARVIAVGDPHQAIYGFRGADSQAVRKLIDRLKATELPLSVCYRCPTSVVALAKELVPQIEARDGAPEGKVETLTTPDFVKQIQVGDYVLCRVTAPLVKRCFEQIRLGKKAVIKGREIGDKLIKLIEKIGVDLPITNFIQALNNYTVEQTERLMAQERESEAIMVKDTADTILVVIEDCNAVSEAINKITMLFNDNAPGIQFMTIHKSKGLQAKKIYILRPDLVPHPMAKKAAQREQELNLLYVAMTRAEEHLVWVTKEEGEK